MSSFPRFRFDNGQGRFAVSDFPNRPERNEDRVVIDDGAFVFCYRPIGEFAGR